VFTNGCFDLLHPGHLYILNEAKKLGDYLIVGVDSDASVRSLNKKPRRPINEEMTRAQILASLKWVDEVVIFDDLEGLIKMIRPDFLVKGGDYASATQIVGADFVKSIGGKVRILPYLEGLSTTKLIHQIRNLPNS
jgi:D-beta-D-heptose 7-phosphate kinase/D-beta-D-heptose 1-phosphate adenosyltransferase